VYGACGRISSVISDGLSLTVIGMTVVFLFLILLVGVMYATSSLVRRVFPAATKPAGGAGAGNQGAEPAIAAAIAAAVSQSRATHEGVQE